MTIARSELVVRTKLRMPRFARVPIARERLLARLQETRSPFMLVSAPAGFGKTTLVTQLAAARQEVVAWFQIDRLDSDPRRFLAHLLAAVQEESPEFGREHLDEVLQREVGADQRDVTRFVNAVGELEESLILVLDDYHEVDNPSVHTLVAALLEHQPPGLTVVMATRREPPLPLARFRARGTITEIGTRDLRFDDREALALVRESLALDLGEPLVAALNQRTEGWAAGLQLAGLSLREVDDASQFIATFDGQDRLVSDYLVQEVLGVQSPEMRRFLLATSILDRMNASLATAVSDVADGQRLLEHLERHNMFVVALDRRREWYRYHHLFGDLLRRQLALQDPALLTACHARACEWYAAHGFLRDAMEHALAIPDDERAAAMLERDGWGLIEAMEARHVSAWAKRIAEPVLSRSIDRLAVALIADMLTGNAIDRRWLERADELEAAGDAGPSHRNLLAWVRSCVLIRARRYDAAARQLCTTVETSDASTPSVLRLAHELGQATAAYWDRDLDRAARLLEHAMRVSLEAHAGVMFFPAVLNLFEVLRLRGDTEAAADLMRRARTQVTQAGWTHSVGMGWIRYGEGEQAYAANDLEAAAAAYREAIDLTRFAGSNSLPLLAEIRLTTIANVRGDRAGALVMANEVAGTAHRPNSSFVASQFDHMLVNMWLALGNVNAAGQALAALALSPDDEIAPSREEDYVALARWHVASRNAGAILPMLARMLLAAESCGRTRSVVELRILQALARQQVGDLRQACVVLESALQTAVDLHDLRMFLDAGSDVVPLLRRVRRQRRLSEDAQRLVDVLCDEPGLAAGNAPQEPRRSAEPLSRQELQVLRLLGAGYSNDEIGRALFVSGNTVKTHLRHIYAKLDVKSRSAAVSRAAALRLLEF